jgi:hypothetical protein
MQGQLIIMKHGETYMDVLINHCSTSDARHYDPHLTFGLLWPDGRYCGTWTTVKPCEGPSLSGRNANPVQVEIQGGRVWRWHAKAHNKR